jgi:hypothetical protein
MYKKSSFKTHDFKRGHKLRQKTKSENIKDARLSKESGT